MIYNTNFFNKEFRNAYMQQSFSRKRQFTLGVFLGLITFAIYFVLQTLKQSVLIDVVPFLMMDSYFSTLSIYLYVSLIFNALLFATNYEYMSFVEIMRNRWYPLVHLGYRPLKLILTKMFVRLVAQFYIYVVGFVMTIFFSSFLKFPFVMGYMFSMLTVGTLDLLLLISASLAISLYFKDPGNAKYVVGAVALTIMLIKGMTGYETIVTNRELMNNAENLFDSTQSVFNIIAVVCIAVCIMICIVRGRTMANVYNAQLLTALPTPTHRGEGVKVSRKAVKTRNVMDTRHGRFLHELPTVLSRTILITLIAFMLGLNGLVLLCGYASPEKETSVFGVIPYVFASTTMEKTIMTNDLAFFNKIDLQEPLAVDEVILFKDQVGTVCVARVKKVLETDELGRASKVNVDIDNYIDERYRGMAAQDVKREQVYGRFAGVSRWLGAIVLFANTIFGRIVLMLIPTFLIFFYDPIMKFFKSINSEHVG